MSVRKEKDEKKKGKKKKEKAPKEPMVSPIAVVSSLLIYFSVSSLYLIFVFKIVGKKVFLRK